MQERNISLYLFNLIMKQQCVKQNLGIQVVKNGKFNKILTKEGYEYGSKVHIYMKEIYLHY